MYKRQAIASYHRAECGLLPVLDSIGIAHLGLRIVLTVGLDCILEFDQNHQLKSKLPGVDGSYGAKTSQHGYDVLFHLISHIESMPQEELYPFVLVNSRPFLN